MSFKKKARVIGLDDAPFSKGIDKKTRLIMVLYRLDSIVERVVAGEIDVDGCDATQTVIEMYGKLGASKAEAFIAEGITMGGFNIPSISEIFETTGVPFIAYVRRFPDIIAMERALIRMNNTVSLQNLRAVNLEDASGNGKQLFLNLRGIEKQDAIRILNASTRIGKTPEPVRLSHLIASALANRY
ncbi:MAG: DUF99 family protein [Candidatus Hadarchaeum sp.]|uniref:endonuclease dU n=1 Tax=Candidatus Hadarchaeum sp. TaxID=2883567 RepID=UPI003164F74F